MDGHYMCRYEQIVHCSVRTNSLQWGIDSNKQRSSKGYRPYQQHTRGRFGIRTT